MPKEYIDREANRESFANCVRVILRDDTTNKRAEEILFEFDALPAANVRENVKGVWMQVEDDEWAGGGKTVCSKCHYGYSWRMYFEVERFKYCPNCGAEMTGGNDG